MKKLLKDKKAITLIALVITIVVLVILAVVTISLTVGNDGLISRAIKAAKGYKDAQERDKTGINDLYGQLTIAADGTIEGLTLTQLEEIIEAKTSPLETTISELNTKVATLESANTSLNTTVTNLSNQLTTQDVSSSVHLNSDYVSARSTVKLTKNGNTMVLAAYLNILNEITDQKIILSIDAPYRPKTFFIGNRVVNGNSAGYLNINVNGNITSSGTIAKSGTTPTLLINATWQV